MLGAGRGEDSSGSQAALEGQRPEVAAAVEAYLRLGNGDLRQALALAVTDAIETAKLVSTGFARWRQPERRRVQG